MNEKECKLKLAKFEKVIETIEEMEKRIEEMEERIKGMEAEIDYYSDNYRIYVGAWYDFRKRLEIILKNHHIDIEDIDSIRY